MKCSYASFVLTAVVLSAPMALPAAGITKCQDASGKWHYGDYAASQCGDEVTELRENGTSVQVRGRQPTKEETEALNKAREQQRQQQLKQEEKWRVDRELLNKFPSEAHLIGMRDQKLVELGKKQTFNEKVLADLQQELKDLPEPITELQKQEKHDLIQRIDRFARAIEQGKFIIEKTRHDYGTLLERYRQIELSR